MAVKRTKDGRFSLPPKLAVAPGEEASPVAHVAWTLARLDPSRESLRTLAVGMPDASAADVLRRVAESFTDGSITRMVSGTAERHPVRTAAYFLNICALAFLRTADWDEVLYHYRLYLDFRGTDSQLLGR